MLSPISALQSFISVFKESSLKNFPTGPFPLILSSCSRVKYANPDAP